MNEYRGYIIENHNWGCYTAYHPEDDDETPLVTSTKGIEGIKASIDFTIEMKND